MNARLLTAASLLPLVGCSSSEDSSCLEDPDWADAPQCVAWRINTESEAAFLDGVLAEIQSASVEMVDNLAYIRVQTEGVPASAVSFPWSPLLPAIRTMRLAWTSWGSG